MYYIYDKFRSSAKITTNVKHYKKQEEVKRFLSDEILRLGKEKSVNKWLLNVNISQKGEVWNTQCKFALRKTSVPALVGVTNIVSFQEEILFSL